MDCRTVSWAARKDKQKRTFYSHLVLGRRFYWVVWFYSYIFIVGIMSETYEMDSKLGRGK